MLVIEIIHLKFKLLFILNYFNIYICNYNFFTEVHNKIIIMLISLYL